MLTNTRRVNVGDYETLEVQGFDAQDNYFNSLEGMRFEWSSPIDLGRSVYVWNMHDAVKDIWIHAQCFYIFRSSVVFRRPVSHFIFLLSILFC